MTSVTTDRRQGLNASIAIKVPCRATTTANITLSGEQTIDGIAIVDGDRVLVKNQTDGIENGIYECDTGTWARTKDWDGTNDIKKGTLIFVHSGTANSGWWYVSTADPITIDTTSVTIAQASTALAVISAFVQTLIDDTDADSFMQTVIASLTAETTPATDDTFVFGDTSEGKGNKMTFENQLKVFNLLTAETAPALADVIALYDNSASAIRKMTPDNFFKIMNLFTEDAAPDSTADFLLEYDTSASAVKKVLPNRFAATQAQMETATSNDAFGTPGRQHYHLGHPKAILKYAASTSTTPTVVAVYNSLGTLTTSRNTTGDYLLGWVNTLTNAAVFLSASPGTTSPRFLYTDVLSTGSSTAFRLYNQNLNAVPTDTGTIYISIYGDLA